MKTASQLSAEAIAALHRGSKIDAIRITREERQAGLKEAKDEVDAYVRAHPEVQSVLASAQSHGGRTLLAWLAVLVAVAWLAWRFLGR